MTGAGCRYSVEEMMVVVQTRCAARRQDGTGRGHRYRGLTALRSSHSLTHTHSHYCTPPPPPPRLISSHLFSLYSHCFYSFRSHSSSQLLRQHFYHGNLIRILLLLMERQSASPLLHRFLNRLPIVYRV